MKLQLTVCVLSLVILVCEAGLFKRSPKKFNYDVTVNLAKDNFEEIEATVLVGLNDASKDFLMFSGRQFPSLTPNMAVTGQFMDPSPVGPVKSIQDITLEWSPKPPRNKEARFILVESVIIKDRDNKGKSQKFCPTNQRIENGRDAKFNKC